MVEVESAIAIGLFTGMILVIVNYACRDYSGLVRFSLNTITFLPLFGATLALFYSDMPLNEFALIGATFIATSAVIGVFSTIVIEASRKVISIFR